jgi:hypothetical protein
MPSHVEIEDIRAMRRRQGIEDSELKEAIRRLRVGDRVQLTLKTAPEEYHGETVLVRITRIRARNFLGKLVNAPVSAALATLRAGMGIAFTAAHVHSVPKGAPVLE